MQTPSLTLLSANPTGPRRVYESTGHSIYHSVQARLEAQLSDTIVGGMSYTFSKLIDDLPESTAQIAGGVGDRASLAAQSLPTFAQNPFDTSRAERALSSLDRRHSFTANFVYSLPLRRGQNGFVGRLLGGWQASGIIEVASGSPFTPLQQIGYSPVICRHLCRGLLGQARRCPPVFVQPVCARRQRCFFKRRKHCSIISSSTRTARPSKALRDSSSPTTLDSAKEY